MIEAIDSDGVSPATAEDKEALIAQAAEFEELFPAILRKMFTFDPDHPVTELPIAQLRACRLLIPGPRTMSNLSEELGITVSAMTQIADRMERAGLVERVSVREDRRIKRLQLSAHGAAMMESRRQNRVQQAAEALAALPEDVREDLMRVLRVMLRVVTLTAPTVRPEDPVGALQEM